MPSEFAAHWTLDPGTTFLNHGSYGATPRAVLEAQAAWRDRMEREPVAFFSRDAEEALDEARAALGAFIGADPEELALVPNATTGIGTVLRSLSFEAGDELVTTDHAYNAGKNALEAAAAAAGARVVIAEIAFPGTTPEAARDAVLAAITPRSRLLLLDHVTSATALVLPIAELVAAAAERGVDTLVDGAHAPGLVDLDVAAIGAAYYAGNCHKWLCAPKGAGFLHVRGDRQHLIRPLAISHGANSPRTDRTRFRLEHDWTGTNDPSAWLSIPAAIAFGASLLSGGWPALRERNRSIALDGRDLLCRTLGEPPPATDEMLSGMVSIPLPVESGPAMVQGINLYDDALHAALIDDYAIQAMITPWPQRPTGGPWRRLVRLSVAAYTDASDLDRLATALATLLGG